MPDSVPGDLDRLTEQLANPDPATITTAVRQLKDGLSRLGGPDYRRAVESLCSLFYVDTADRPDLEPVLDEATEVLAGQGTKVIGILLAQMRGSDIKSHLYLARTLAHIGAGALAPLRDILATDDDAYARAFALYALGKMTCAEVAGALPEVIGGLMHPDKEVRDTAARTLGRIAAVVPAAQFTARRRQEMFDALVRAGQDHQPAVRAKAMRSLGKMAQAGLLDAPRRNRLIELARGALGQSGEYVWDPAFIVRREAREALQVATAD